ncbi:MAG: orotidine-5'-phosphate decarboxylase [Parcubacteria group bacterium Gr01-1014_20]|nr:MAG: orotidine-5'-phosphate decarboxylase [Parcubacteria group bacterium Gr01-1014_20]
MRNYHELQKARWEEGLFVCIGLDTDPEKVPAHRRSALVESTMLHFNCDIVDATRDIVSAYKPNTAFYKAHGSAGIRALQATTHYINLKAPDVPVILDDKSGDIGNTNNGHVKFAFEYCNADALTINPYVGRMALEPFLANGEKGFFILCRTSNPGAGEFQDLPVQTEWAPDGTMFLYEYVAFRAAKDWNEINNCGVVVGATVPDELLKVRQLVGDMPILIPGVGAQGGDLEAILKVCRDSTGQGMIINISRSAIYASSGPDFADRARDEVVRMNQIIQRTLGITKGE